MKPRDWPPSWRQLVAFQAYLDEQMERTGSDLFGRHIWAIVRPDERVMILEFDAFEGRTGAFVALPEA